MNQILKGFFAFALVALLATSAMAAQTNFDIGKVGGSELKIGLGPRPVAMGEAFVAKADDWNASAWNSAGLAQIKGLEAGFMHNVYLEETALEYLGFATSIFEGAGIGANIMILNYGTLDKIEVDSNGLPNKTGEFTPLSYKVQVGYGQFVMPALAVGGSVTLLSQSIDTETYSAFAVDVGALFKLDELGADGFSAGLAVQNLGTSLAESSLPMNAKVGLGYVPSVKIAEKDVWTILLDVNLPFGDVNYTSANLGTEYFYDDLFAVRAGYKIKDSGDLGGATGLTAGLGAKVPLGDTTAMSIDYALLSYGDLGITHQVSLSVALK